jgi:hypothetical protein
MRHPTGLRAPRRAQSALALAFAVLGTLLAFHPIVQQISQP